MIKKQLTFREYYESKKRLLLASETAPRVRQIYNLTKYCRFPIYESLDEDHRSYVSFKPKDQIEVLWELVNECDNHPTPKSIWILSEQGRKVYPCWNKEKIQRWIENNTVEKN